MKTTLHIPDELLRRARQLADRQGTTVEALTEEALRRLVDQPAPPAATDRRVRPVVVGKPDEWVSDDLRQWDGRRIRDELYRRPTR